MVGVAGYRADMISQPSRVPSGGWHHLRAAMGVADIAISSQPGVTQMSQLLIQRAVTGFESQRMCSGMSQFGGCLCCGCSDGEMHMPIKRPRHDKHYDVRV